MKIKLLLTAITFVVFCNWMPPQIQHINKAKWLLGAWENRTPRGSIFELWQKVNDHEFAGKSYFIKEKDTVILETIQLVQEDQELFYIPTVKNQNEGMPVRFGMKTISNESMVFENPDHDFPQIISYTRMNKDSLVAEISGRINGKERKRSFPMKRLK